MGKMKRIIGVSFTQFTSYIIVVYILFLDHSNACSAMNIATAEPETNKISQLLVYCDPCIKAYEYIGFIGSGESNGFEFVEEKIVETPNAKSATQSNTWYDYWIREQSYRFIYCDSTVKRLCISKSYGTLHYKDGPPAKTYKGEEQIIKTDTTIYVYKTLYDVIDDSTFVMRINENSTRKITSTKIKFAVETVNKNDMWNVEILMNEQGFPIRITTGNSIRYFKYLAVDQHGNWIKRMEMDGKGNVIKTLERRISYRSLSDISQNKGAIEENDYRPHVVTCRTCGGDGLEHNEERMQKRIKYHDPDYYLCPVCRGRGKYEI